MPAVKFRAGLLKDLPKNRNSNTLYWVTDTRQLYKGNDLYTETVRVVAELPDTPLTGILYLVNGVAMAYTGSDWVTVAVPVSNDASEQSENVTLSAAAVHEAIEEAVKAAVGDGGVVAPSDVINNIVSTEAGTITVTKGSTDESIKLAGIVYEPTYDAATRTIKLPFNKMVDGVVQSDELVIALGQDMVVSDGSHYDKETGKLVLVLSNGEEVEIPVGDLVSTVEISAEAGNALVEKEDGLFVKDLSGEIAAVSEEIAGVKATVEAHGISIEEAKAGVQANAEEIDGVKATVEAHGTAIEEAKAGVQANAEAIAAINHEETGILAQAKAYADSITGEITWDVFEPETV